MFPVLTSPHSSLFQAAFVVLTLTASCQAGLLGAGHGEGSCAAAPFRTAVELLKWPAGCPPGAECCTEFGYCRPQVEWAAGNFRDCNGVSNGQPLSPETIAAEAEAAAYGDPAAAALIAVPAAPAAPAVVATPVVASYAQPPVAPVASYAPAPVASYAPAPAAPVAAYAPAPVASYAPVAPVASYAPVAASYAQAPVTGYNYYAPSVY